MPNPDFRRLTITLTIVVIVAHPSCGFTLLRKTTAEAIPEPKIDLASQESLQIKNLKRPNDIGREKEVDNNKPIKDKHRFTSEVKIIDSEYPTERMLDTTITDVITRQAVVTQEKEAHKVNATNSASETTTQAIKSHPESNTISMDESFKNSTESIQTTLLSSSILEYSTMTTVKPTESELMKTEQEVMSTTNVPNLNYQISKDSDATTNIVSQRKPVVNGSTVNIIETDNTMTETETSTKTLTSILGSFEVNEKPNVKILTEAATEVLFSKADTGKELLDDTSKSASTVVEVKVTNDTSPTTTEPKWKKYTTIERKRGESSEEITTNGEREHDSTKAESIQTTLPIPSLEILGEDLLLNHNHLSTLIEPQTERITIITEPVSTSESITSTQLETLGTVESKRGGFLDLSKRTSPLLDETKTDKNIDYRTVYEIEATDIETHEIKKQNGYESQGQLAEDAIKEELLKEESINNHDENKRYEEGKDGVKLAAITNTVYMTTSQSITDDTLSVQPISQDRRTTLYTVGANYKPMKRIDVQPAKPFVRDPDDNSWRNESISSLGIVFKPKNSSSKSFKEVLKTKTETEFNNLQDKDNKNDAPELRERLEKIAEVRKSKKKGIDKFGEVVYTDYGEGGSAEGTNIPETTPTNINYSDLQTTITSKVPEKEVTAFMTTTESQRYWKNELETTNKDAIFKDLGLDILTTVKTEKPYNLAEYYDTTDEYDADYANQQKLDLKKFTVPFERAVPSLRSPKMPLLTTRSMPPQFPERKPTVQYFPPTTKPQKVNMNDYDIEFEKRVQYYTLKETPKTNSPFDDVATVEVATNRPGIRPTVRPSDFTLFTPQTPDSLDKHTYMTNDPPVTEPQNFVIKDGNFRGTYVIKHYRDFLNEAARDEEDERTTDFVFHTKAPVKETSPESSTLTYRERPSEVDYEYDSQFRKHVLNRFVDNFNQNSEKFKVDFPVLFNTSVVHRSNDDEGRVVASSSTFMKRLYGNPFTKAHTSGGCEPNCDNVTVELSPAYELHYYVPEQEEKEEVDQSSATLPYHYKL